MGNNQRTETTNFLEFHPKFINKRNPNTLKRLVDELFKLYNLEYTRNHWGRIKGEETANTEWEKATPNNIFKIVDEIILNDQRPNAFAIHCFQISFKFKRKEYMKIEWT